MWAITWEWNGVRYLIDVDDEEAAFRLAVSIAESGRANVAITPVDFQLDEETRQKIQRRVEERLKLHDSERV